ncbi:MAG: tetratricopeptide repeat protein [Spirochaetales bacterium]|nr:tetratricopeptide repeat protein [Spirochaetales bacterium]MCF7937295.1 tetratricopeptide repeat protein [Spirochaetales bacterium]
MKIFNIQLIKPAAAAACLSFILIFGACSSSPEQPENITAVKNQAAQYEAFGNNYFEQAKYQQALQFYQQGLEYNISVYNEPGIVKSYNSIARVFVETGSTDRAERTFLKAYRIAKDLDNNVLLAQTANNLGSLYLKTGREEEAFELFQEALELSEGTEKESVEESILYHNLGMSYKLRGNYKQAKLYLHKALEKNLENREFKEAASNYYGLASVESKQNRYEQALDYARSALENDRKMEYSYGIAKDLKAIGIIQEKAGNLEASYESLKKSLLVFGTLNLVEDIIDILVRLEAAARELGKPKEAEEYAATLKNIRENQDK